MNQLTSKAESLDSAHLAHLAARLLVSQQEPAVRVAVYSERGFPARPEECRVVVVWSTPHRVLVTHRKPLAGGRGDLRVRLQSPYTNFTPTSRQVTLVAGLLFDYIHPVAADSVVVEMGGASYYIPDGQTTVQHGELQRDVLAYQLSVEKPIGPGLALALCEAIHQAPPFSRRLASPVAIEGGLVDVPLAAGGDVRVIYKGPIPVTGRIQLQSLEVTIELPHGR